MRLAAIIAVLVFLVCGGASSAQEDPQDISFKVPFSGRPQLVVETGGHSGPVHRLAADSRGERLVSISPDKTARVWNVETGRLEHVLRIPIGPGANGRLWAIAMSPDGKQVAVSGNTYAGGPAPQIYVFDPVSGEMIKQVAATPGKGNVVTELAWSPDGRYLAVGQAGAGLKVFLSADWSVAGEDREIRSTVRGLAFDRSAQVVVATTDGVLRRYDLSATGMKLLTQASAPITRIDRLKLSPDGKRIALIGGDASVTVNVLDAANFEPLFARTAGPDNIKRGNLGTFATATWTANGEALLAGGTCCAPLDPRTRAPGAPSNLLFRWPEGAPREGSAIELPPFNILDLVPLPGNRIAFATAEPGLGVVDAGGKTRFLSQGNLIDFRGSALGLAVSSDARRVRYSYQSYDRAPVQHDFDQLAQSRPTAQGAQSDKHTKSAVLSAAGVKLSNWWTWPPKPPELDGKPLTQGPTARALAFAPDQRTFAFGLTNGVRLFDTSGKELWQNVSSTVTRSVVISDDARFVVTASDDGRIRWLRHSDGVELLTLFAHSDQKRWVAWTPQGYFAASNGGEALFGWHVNRGPGRAGEFYPAARFFDERHRPDIVLEILRSAQTDRQVIARLKIVQKVNIAEGFKPPPLVEVLAPATGQVFEDREVSFKVALADQGGGIGEVRIFHNGRALAIPSAVEKNALAQRFALVTGENTFVVSALSADGVESEPVTVKVIRRAPPTPPALYALVVGINRYRNTALNLNYAEKDARAIADFFGDAPVKKLYREVHVRTLLNEEATSSNIRLELDRLVSTAAKEDTVVLYFAGHGEIAAEEWYFVPHEVTEPESDEMLAQGGISRQFFQDMLKKLPAQKVLVLLDACKSGAATGATRSIVDRKAIMNLARSTGTYIVAASGGDQLAIEVPKLGHGVFTWTLLQGLRGKAGEKRITAESLITYVKNTMPEIAEQFRGRPQFPVSWGGGSDFALVLHN
jgi:WD40 repeat protein